ncbi:MTH1187 family thiamine-binding protein [Bacillus sp. JCM 19041]|uniref:MTH1187 family thiamine-binding protein n=1 Tax=Bacillus sp. JCM 19041 TaxID=1460637 RepID=UPI0006D0EEC5
MAIADVTIIPIGTSTPSVSSYIAKIQLVLEEFKQDGKLSFELTPMSTLIEAELPVLFEVIQKIHELPFENGANRVATNIRIDDRRDKRSTLDSKRKSVKDQLDKEKS